MAFNNIGFFTIEPGKTLHLSGWTWPNSKDMGAQFFGANPIHPIGWRGFATGPLISFDQGESLADAEKDGLFPVFAAGRSYEFKVRNAGPETIAFDVHGGGYV
jgi:hypothetical protein